MPVSISYEFDPNDYLKVREFLQKRRDPDFKKSQRDDLFSMETGLLQFKGKVHFQLTPRINSKLEQMGIFMTITVQPSTCAALLTRLYTGVMRSLR